CRGPGTRRGGRCWRRRGCVRCHEVEDRELERERRAFARLEMLLRLDETFRDPRQPLERELRGLLLQLRGDALARCLRCFTGGEGWARAALARRSCSPARRSPRAAGPLP